MCKVSDLIDQYYPRRPQTVATPTGESAAIVREQVKTTGVAAVAAGSLPVSSAEALAELWEGQANAIRSNAARHLRNSPRARDKADGAAEQLEACADELRRWAALWNPRQPEENIQG